jgi:hypothetical protein
MLTTTQLVTFIKDKFAQDWSRTSILDLLNTVQHIMCDHDCDQMVFTCDNSDFPVPFLSTTTGTIEYEVTNANLSNNITLNGYATTCRRVKDIFIKIDSPYEVDYQRQYWRETFSYSNINPWYTKSLAHVTFERVPARFIDKRGIQNAKVIFPEDPQTHTDRYYIEFWMNPVELSSESIPMSVNTSEFFDVILDGVVGLIEQSEHGQSERYDRFMNSGCKKFWTNINKGYENKPLQIQRKEC